MNYLFTIISRYLLAYNWQILHLVDFSATIQNAVNNFNFERVSKNIMTNI